MKISKQLADYIALRKSREFGWRRQFEDNWVKRDSTLARWNELAGLYSMLLDELIDTNGESYG